MSAELLILAWPVLAVILSRPIYGHLRARSIDIQRRRRPSLYSRDPVGEWNDYDRGGVILGAAGVALAWPLLIPAYVAYRWMTGSKIRSSVESAQERDTLTRRIGELERELLGGDRW